MRVTPLGLSAIRKRFRSPQAIMLLALVLIASAYLSLVPTSSHAATPVLLSQGKPATASSVQDAFTAAAAVDGNTGTRWSSAASDPQWLQVDLGSSQPISQVVLNWETAYATAFKIQTSADGSTWNDIYSTTTGAGGTQTLNVTGTGRYVRMYGTQRATQWGYSLWEFQVYGGSGGGTTPPATCGNTTAALGKPATASSTENAGTPAQDAFDGNAGTRWSSAASDPQWVQVDLGSSQSICGAQLTWETAYAKAYQIQLSDNGSTWNTVYSTTTGPGGVENLSFSGTGRYVRMYGTARATQYGYSLWEFTVLTPGGTSTTPPPGGGNGDCPWVGSTAPVATRVSQVMAQMTTAQKVSILHGNNSATPYIGNITGIPSLCIPNIGLQDGPAGVGDGVGGVTQMPSGNASAATFDDALEQQYGAAIGAEFAGKGVQVALGPTLNIVRDPRWGRSFESFSEDPYLNGRLAAADIRGIQSQGVMAEMKHVAVYNIENPAGTVIVDKRTMQELYLPAFQAAIQQGSPAAAMCAYSIVNSVPACQNPDLLNTGLYQQANFGGFVTSDWGGTHSTVESANAGLTVEMPNGYFYADFLAQAVANGTVTQTTLNTMVSRLLTQFFAFGLFDKAPSGSHDATVTTPAHVQVALQGAEEGAVLLKNNGILPLSTSTTHSIAVIGWDGGAGVQSIGGGSATVTSSGTVWPITGIQNRVAGTGTTVQYNDATNLSSAVTLARSSDVAIVFASDNYGNEEHDTTTLDLPNNGGSTTSQNDMIAQVAAANPHTIVVLDNNSAINMPWLSQVAGVFEAFYPGQQIGTAMAALIFGDVNPSGKLPVTFPKSLADVPASTPAQWPGTNGQVQYSEGLNVGYKWYDAKNITPLFPFGFGLSYTSFGFSNLQVGALSGGNSTVHVTVTNTGSRAGTEVAQLYVGDPASTGEPVHQLRGYQRVTLNPGQAQTLTFTVATHDLAYWNTGTNNWTTAAGTYQILVGDSSRNLPVTGTLTVPTTVNAAMAATITPKAAAAGQAATAAPLTVPNPHGMSGPVHAAVDWTFDPNASGLAYTATGLPPGIALSSAGRFTGAATKAGTFTVTVTARNAAGASGSATFVWTATP
ncbi:beta-glucosidase [Streptomyces sp. DvalAA-14]|uniref:discoidin domain-containing protein n=2 Tax=unclassified Streptomyces TaxID=2593676 RepID=UPI00081B1DB9|nr:MULTISPECIES: discoidin domain-containing protein [unclassified Streptomyces]MYS21579.1 beta-glucosidase [Streptomyces sp. SID4948]SCD96034.1 beta-glucosidase [Streptomyces sp. DvalAA-14]